jgi:hypothetical protein
MKSKDKTKKIDRSVIENSKVNLLRASSLFIF